MSVMDVTSRIQQIQGQLAMLSPPSAAGPGFATALAQASSPAATTTTLTTPNPTGTGSDVVADARKYLGIPYLWGGTDPARGLDCSGLVQKVYRDLGYDLPRVSADQARVGTAVPSLDQAQPGDLLAFGSPVHHIAIYAGDGKMIEAPHSGATVRVSDVYETPTAIRHVLGAVQPSPGGLAARPVLAGGAGPVPADVPFGRLFAAAGQKYGVDPTLLAAVAKQESGYNPRAVSGVGAQGLMQLMPGTAAGLGVRDPFDPAQAVDGAARMLRDLTGRFGSTELALAAYNAGPGAVLKYGGVPPYPETQHYVRNVLALRDAL
jgi:hypothetical protein